MEEIEVRIPVLRSKSSDNTQNNQFTYGKLTFPGNSGNPILLG